MNNEFESGRYGIHLKYFQSLSDYNDYLDSSLTAKVRPNISYCDGNEKYVKYNWESSDTVVLTEESNERVFKLLEAANIPYTGINGYTISDLGAITLDDIYCSTGGSGGWSGLSWGEANKDYWDDPTDFCLSGISIFYMYSKSDGGNTSFYWNFPEFQYFTGISSIPKEMFSSCFGLQQIIIPSTVTFIGESAFHDCHNLTEVIIQNESENVDIYDTPYSDDSDNNGSHSAFSYTGITMMDGDYEYEVWWSAYGGEYTSSLERVIGEGILAFQPQS